MIFKHRGNGSADLENAVDYNNFFMVKGAEEYRENPDLLEALDKLYELHHKFKVRS